MIPLPLVTSALMAVTHCRGQTNPVLWEGSEMSMPCKDRWTICPEWSQVKQSQKGALTEQGREQIR